MHFFFMGWFSKAETKEEQSMLMQKVSEMTLRVIEVEAEVTILKQGLKVLRGFVNKKVGIEPDDDEQPEIVIEESDGFDNLRNLRKQVH